MCGSVVQTCAPCYCYSGHAPPLKPPSYSRHLLDHLYYDVPSLRFAHRHTLFQKDNVGTYPACFAAPALLGDECLYNAPYEVAQLRTMGQWYQAVIWFSAEPSCTMLSAEVRNIICYRCRTCVRLCAVDCCLLFSFRHSIFMDAWLNWLLAVTRGSEERAFADAEKARDFAVAFKTGETLSKCVAVAAEPTPLRT